jgi:hypothetical protein
MNFVRLLPVFLSSLVLAAHFFRSGMLSLASICVTFPAVLLIRRPWPARAVQLGLILGSAEWLRTVVVIAAYRQSMGAPWLRMAAILGGMTAFTAGSSLVFRMRALRQRYALDSGSGTDSSTVSHP